MRTKRSSLSISLSPADKGLLTIFHNIQRVPDSSEKEYFVSNKELKKIAVIVGGIVILIVILKQQDPYMPGDLLNIPIDLFDPFDS